MIKLITTVLVVCLSYAPASAQLVEMVFGPLDGDNAGILYADFDQTIEVDLWIRTAPGISIVGFHIPLSSKDEHIDSNSRQGGGYCQLLHVWDEVDFLSPNPDPIHAGYTTQSFFGLQSDVGNYDCYEGIDTEGQWWWIASFSMITVSNGPTGIPLCDAFIEGYHPDQEGTILFDCYIAEIEPSDVEFDFACLWFVESSCGDYVIGDYNGSGAFNVADIVDSYSKLKTGLPEPASICECPPESGDFWAVAADVNNSCAFNVADIVDGYSFLKTGLPEPEPCWMCPPGEP